MRQKEAILKVVCCRDYLCWLIQTTLAAKTRYSDLKASVYKTQKQIAGWRPERGGKENAEEIVLLSMFNLSCCGRDQQRLLSLSFFGALSGVRLTDGLLSLSRRVACLCLGGKLTVDWVNVTEKGATKGGVSKLFLCWGATQGIKYILFRLI